MYDDGRGVLSPLTDLRAAFDVRTGALTTLERARMALDLDVRGLIVPAGLAALTRERHRLPVNEEIAAAGPAGTVVVINGRCVLPHAAMLELEAGEKIVEEGTGELVAAGLEAGDLPAFVEKLDAAGEVVGELESPALMTRPWHVRTFRDRAMAVDLEVLADAPTQELPPGVLAIGDGENEEALTIDPTAVVYPGVTLDTEHGAIVIAEKAVVRPGAILVGPVYVGPGSTVLERALIRGNTAIGPVCKVAGEIGGTIFQGYANKGHDGYLGDSWVGEWVNLGAGTTNSNLLNTYGEVIACAAPGGSNERTGEQFLGAMIGDHVKTAICTRIMTGTVIHTGAMLAQTAAAAGCVPGFAWWTDVQRRAYRLDKFMETMRAAMARRKVTPTEAYAARIEELHAPRKAAE